MWQYKVRQQPPAVDKHTPDKVCGNISKLQNPVLCLGGAVDTVCNKTVWMFNRCANFRGSGYTRNDDILEVFNDFQDSKVLMSIL